MSEPLRDHLRLLHILEACDRIKSYYPDNKIPVLHPKSIEFFGLVKNLEIIGEAAYMLTPEFTSSHPSTAWNDIVRMRHLLVHGYYHISPEIVKEIAETEIRSHTPLYIFKVLSSLVSLNPSPPLYCIQRSDFLYKTVLQKHIHI